MKFIKSFRHWATICLGLSALVAHTAAATLSLEPSQITTEYQGAISLQIGGVDAEDTVIVEKYMDLNGNETIDAGEPLTMQVRLEDNELAMVDGVLNRNIPSDLNSTSGTITAEVSLHELDRFAGMQIFRVSSASSSFTAVTASLTVTPPTYSQAISGVVHDGSAPLPHAYVGLLGVDEDILVGGAIAGADGSFSIPAAPGDYVVVVVKSGYIITEIPVVTLQAEATATQDVELAATPLVISGSLSDADTGEKLPGNIVFLDAEDVFTFTYTDADGNFEAGVPSAFWEVEVGAETLSRQGYLTVWGEANTETGNATGVDLEVSKATSLVHGYLTNVDGTPMPGIEIYAINVIGEETYGYTDAEGYFLLGVSAGQWWVSPEQEDLVQHGLGAQGTSITISNSEAMEVNFQALAFTASIHGRVVDHQGNPIAYLEVYGNNWEDGGGSYTETDANGYFTLPVFGGTWQLGLDAEHLAGLGALGPSLDVDVTEGVDVSGLVISTSSVNASISGRVESDAGGPVAFLNVYAYMTSDSLTYYTSATTDINGFYSMAVISGTWVVYISEQDLAPLGFIVPPIQETVVTGGSASANFLLVESVPLEIITTSLPEATVGSLYSETLTVSGGVPPYHFTIAAGSEALPPGLDFSWQPESGDNSLLTGTPEVAGSFTFTVEVWDSQGNRVEQQLTLSIAGGVSEPPQFGEITRLAGGSIGIRLNGEEGKSYRVEVTTSLASPAWEPLETFTAGAGGEIYLEDNTGGQSLRFYRSVEVQ